MLRRSFRAGFCRAIFLALAAVSASAAYGTAFTDRSSFNAALVGAGLTGLSDDYESYSLGPIANGGTRGAFSY
jgi:hypothetical protein